MRKGFNPHKDQPQQDSDFFHQVIIPVYVPDATGYFADGFAIFQYCITSLLKTMHSKTFVTIVNNGSSGEVRQYLDDLVSQKRIHEIIHTDNIGKLNSVLKGLSGHGFQYVTVADADVLFVNGWQEESYRIFDNFPKAGAVCPTPSSKSLRTYTYNIWFDLFFSDKLRFTKVKNPSALTAFAQSIDNPDFYNEHHLTQYLTVTENDVTAVVGAGHFVTTYRGEIFSKLKRSSGYKLGGSSETEILDIPVIRNGLWRLSTADNFTLHMGNVEEPWMKDALQDITRNTYEPQAPRQFQLPKSSQFSYFIKTRLFGKLMGIKKISLWFLKRKGLSSDAIKTYI